jgi:hypothetical protein
MDKQLPDSVHGGVCPGNHARRNVPVSAGWACPRAQGGARGLRGCCQGAAAAGPTRCPLICRASRAGVPCLSACLCTPPALDPHGNSS